jgi:hypothetical protein
VHEIYEDEVRDSLLPPQQLLNDITFHLALKGESLSIFHGASDEEVQAFWKFFC